MAMFKLAAAGALGFVAYRLWQRYQAEPGPTPIRDEGRATAPHGDPILTGAHLETAPTPEPAPAPRAAAHSSRSFGEP